MIENPNPRGTTAGWDCLSRTWPSRCFQMRLEIYSYCTTVTVARIQGWMQHW